MFYLVNVVITEGVSSLNLGEICLKRVKFGNNLGRRGTMYSGFNSYILW